MSKLGSWFRQTIGREAKEDASLAHRGPLEVGRSVSLLNTSVEEASFTIVASPPVLPSAAGGGGIVATDPKKVATMVGICANQIEIIRAAMIHIEAVKAAFQLANPDVTGTPLEGAVAMVNQAIVDLKTETDKEIWTQLIVARVPSHRNAALEV